MKCPNCDYFNLPGAQTCGRCLRPLGMAAAVAEVEELVPPRRANRSALGHFEASLSPAGRRILRGEALTNSRFARIFQARDHEENFGDFLVRCGKILLAVVPGFPQALERRFLAAILLAGLLLCDLVAFRGSFYQPISDLFLWGIGVLSVASVFDASARGEEWTRPLAPFRALRHLLTALSVVALLSFAGLFLFYYRFTPIQIGDTAYYLTGNNMGAPVVRNGDTLIFENFDFNTVKRGDLVMQEDDDIRLTGDYAEEYYIAQRTERTLWKVVGLPGDKIASQNGVLSVNNTPVPRQELPTIFKAPAGIDQRVPPGKIAVCGVVFGYQVTPHTFTGPPSRFSVLPYRAFQRRAVAAIGPPQHRRMLR